MDGIRQQVYSSLGISALLSSDTSPRRPHHHHDNQAHHLTSRQPHQYSNQSHHHGNHHHSNIKSQPRVKQPYQLLTEQVGGAMQADHAPPLLPPIEPRPSDHSPPKAHGFTDNRPLPALTNRYMQAVVVYIHCCSNSPSLPPSHFLSLSPRTSLVYTENYVQCPGLIFTLTTFTFQSKLVSVVSVSLQE